MQNTAKTQAQATANTTLTTAKSIVGNKGTLAKTATKIAATALSARLLPNLLADTAMATADQLRSKAASDYQKFEMKGRAATLKLMADVYALYYDTKISSDNGEAFMAKVKAKLAQLEVKVRKSSPETSQLIRYICKDFDDKQVSIYGRSLAVALANGIEPSGFTAFIEGTTGGFAGVAATTVSKKVADAIKLGEDIALVHVRAETTVESIDVTDWQEGEEYRVLIAVRNDDDTADVKNARLSKDSTTAVVLRYMADRKARSKPKHKQSAEDDKLALNALSAEASNAKTKWENIDADLSLALDSGDRARCDLLRVQSRVASLQAKAAETVYKQLKASLKESALIYSFSEGGHSRC